MSLLSPLFLLGALAVALPLWLHLLQRQNPIKLPFSSLMFFERRPQSSFKERRLRYLLLLASRLALLLLLALAFAKPVWERPPAVVAGRTPTLHLIVMDTSLSMGYGDRWQRALAAAEVVVDQMERRDRAQVVASGPGIRVITQPSGDRPAIKAALRSLQPTASRNSYGEVAEAVRSLTPASDVPVEVHLVSDLQQSAVPGRFSDLALPTAASLKVHEVSDSSAENWCVESVKGTTRLSGNKKPRLEVTVASFSEQQASKRVTLRIDRQSVASRSVEVPPFGRASVVFEGFEPPRGRSRGEVILEPGDALALDDTRLVPFDNIEPSPILFVSNDPRRRDLLFYQAALDSSAESVFQVQGASPGEADRLTPDRFALVVVSDVPQLPTLFAGRLKNYVEAGGSLLLAVGPKITLAGRAPLSPRKIEAVRYEGRQGERFQLTGEIDASHPVLRQVERFRGVKFFRHARLSTVEGDDVSARLSDGTPLLVEEKMGDGRIMTLASSLDNVWNDLPVHPVFVPFVVESARYLSGIEEGSPQAIIDSALELRKRRSPGSTVQAFDPSGERALSLQESLSEQILPLTQLGFYEVRRTGDTELVAVNPDPRESNLRPIDADTLALWKATGRQQDNLGASAAADSAIKPPPIKIWRLLLLLLVASILLESVVGNWHLNTRREV